MNVNLELYRVFYTVAKKGNIIAASHELLISQPAISKSIKSLEEALGGKLFVRSKKGVTLTNEGEELYKYISKSMEYIELAESKFKDLINLDAGTIRIGISTTLTKLFLLPKLEEYRTMYPKINISILTSATPKLFENLKDGLLDIVIYNSPIDLEKEFNIIKIKKIHDSFFVGEKYKDLTKKNLKLADLNNYPLVLQNNESNIRKYLDEFCLKHDVVLKESMNASSFTLSTEFTKKNYGIGFLTKEYVKDDIDKTLFELNVTPKIPNRFIAIATNEKNTNFSTKKLIDLLTKEEQ